jgi:hypothetical protein
MQASALLGLYLACYPAAPMSLMPPIPVRLVPGLLRARGLKVSRERIRDALESGAISGCRERYRWVLTPEDVDAAERYFREVDTSGGQKAGAAALEEAKRRSRQSRGSC